VPALDIRRLNSGGSLYVTRPTIVDYTRTPQELRGRTDEHFDWVDRGKLRLKIGGRYSIGQVSEAFTALETRQTMGKVILTH
jgi:NADPH2:quinone reductase